MASHIRPARLLLVVALLATALMAFGASSASAADPDHVNFTLEGCRPDAPQTFSGALPFVCDNADYTTGNLGKFWNELDLVPHRLTAETGTNNPGYDVTITADYLDGNCAMLPAPGEYTLAAVPVTQAMIDAGCTPGYDYITEPTLNAALSSGSCTITFGDPMVLVPGAGGTDASIYREVHIVQSAGSHCVWDYDERLALGSHLYSGSSLHSNMLNEDFGTAGVGARDISIPVKEIQPQTLSKTMTATQGQSNVWNVGKSSNTSNVDFPNVCDPNGTRTQEVEITVTWTKTTTAAGVITVRTIVRANNPAHRALIINVVDKTYKGTGQAAADLVHTETTNNVTLDPGSHVVQDYSVEYPQGTATTFNDVVTATYSDPVVNQPIGGAVSAAASSAVVQGIAGANDSAVITDTEDVIGAGIEFSVDSRDPVALGGYDGGYAEDTFTDAPVTWSSGTVTGNGSVTFTKTVRVNGTASTSGVLTDQAQVLATTGNPPAVLATSDNGAAAGPQPLDIPITATGCSSIGGTKYSDLNSSGGRDVEEPGLGGWQFYVDYNDNGALDAGEPSATSAADGTWTITGIEPGSFKVREVGQAPWVCTEPAQSDANGCHYGPVTFSGGPVTAPAGTFGNHNPLPGIAISKVGPATATAGDLLPYTIVVTNPGEVRFPAANVVVPDPQCTAPPVLQVKNRGDGEDPSPDFLDPGDAWVYGCAGQTQTGQTNFVNQACVSATDEFGREVNACDDVNTLLGERQVAGTRVEPGTARLAGRSGCVAKVFNAVVRGRSINKVVFRIDGKKRAVVRSPDAQGRYKLRVNPKTFKPGSHLLVARTTFRAESNTSPKTMRLRFQRCVRRTEPAFTG
jgi:hypothetical protein